MSDHEINRLVDLILKQKKQTDIHKELKFSDILSSILSKLDIQQPHKTDDLKVVIKPLPSLHLKAALDDSFSVAGTDVKKHQFPPMKATPPPGTDTYPYDPMTVGAMNSKHKGRKAPLVTSKVPQPGGDGTGIFQKSFKSSGNMPSSSSSWDKKGVPGWSRSLPDKEFEIPNELKPSQIGTPTPKFAGPRNLNRMGARPK